MRWITCNTGVSSEQDAQRDRKRQHPLAHRHARDDMIDQVGGSLCHAPRPARGAKPSPLARKGYELLMAAVPTAQPQEAVGENAAVEKGVKLLFDKLR